MTSDGSMCKECGASIPPDATFCRSCGAVVSKPAPVKGDESSTMDLDDLISGLAGTAAKKPPETAVKPDPQKPTGPPPRLGRTPVDLEALMAEIDRKPEEATPPEILKETGPPEKPPVVDVPSVAPKASPPVPPPKPPEARVDRPPASRDRVTPITTAPSQRVEAAKEADEAAPRVKGSQSPKTKISFPAWMILLLGAVVYLLGFLLWAAWKIPGPPSAGVMVLGGILFAAGVYQGLKSGGRAPVSVKAAASEANPAEEMVEGVEEERAEEELPERKIPQPVSTTSTNRSAIETSVVVGDTFPCPVCNSTLTSDATECKSCGTTFEEG